MANLTRIKNNQITDSTILANTKIVPGSIVGSLFNSNLTMSSDVTITGNLTVQGTSTYLTVASTNTYVNDPLIVLNNAFTGTNTYDVGVIFNRGNQTSAILVYSESADEFRLGYTSNVGALYGAVVMSNYGNLHVGNLTIDSALTAGSLSTTSMTLSGDLAVNGGDITSTASTFNLLNSLVTTANILGSATTINFGASTGLTAINNNLTVADILYVNAGIASTSTTTGTMVVNGGVGLSGNIYAGRSIVANNGVYSANIYNGSYTGGIVIDYNTGMGRISVGSNDGLTIYNSGIANVALVTVHSNGNVGISGNLTSGNISTASLVATNLTGTLLTAAQTNITSVGNLSALAASGTIQTTGIVYANSTTASTSTTTGALVVNGGVGVSGNINAGNVTVTNLTGTLLTAAQTNITSLGNLSALAASGTIQTTGIVYGNSGIGGTLLTASQTNITSVGNLSSLASSGTIQTTGRVYGNSGIGGTLLTAAQTNITSVGNLSALAASGTIQTTGIVYGNSGIGGTLLTAAQTNITSVGILTGLNVSGTANVTNTTNSTAYNNGALVVAGGLGVAKDVYIQGNLYVSNILATSANVLTVTEPLLYLFADHVYPYNFDIGFYSHFTGGSANVYQHTGFIRNDSDNKWYLFSNVPEPLTSQVGVTDANVIYDQLVTGAHTVHGAVTGNANITQNLGSTSTWWNNTYTGNLYAPSIYGTLQTASQTNITSVGNLSSLASSGTIQTTGIVYANSTTASTSTTTGALVVNGGVGVSGNINATNYYGTLQTASQTNITSLGNLSALAASGTIQTTGIVYGNSGIGGTLLTAAQTNITSVGNLSSLASSGTIQTTGIVYANANISSTSTTTGALLVRGGVGVSGNIQLGLGANINVSQSSDFFRVNGKFTSLIYADSNTGAVIIGGANTTVQGGTTLKVSGTGAMMIPVGTAGQRPGLTGNVDVAGMLRFNTSISMLEFYDGTAWQTTQGGFTVIAVDSYTADGTANVFTMSGASTTNATVVAINGVVQAPILAYSVSGTSLTFTENPAAGDLIDVRRLTTTATVSSIINNTSSISIDSNAYGNALVNITGNVISTTTAQGVIVNGNVSATNFVGNGALLTGIVASSSYGNAQVASYLPTYTGSFGNLASGITSSGTIQTTGIVYGNSGIGGTLLTAAQTNITSVGTLTSLGVSGAITVNSGNNATAIVNGGTAGAGNIGASGAGFNTVFAKATTALYADLAEKYLADNNYEPGTVLEFGGLQEVTKSSTPNSNRVAGIVSTNPAYLMNDSLKGEYVVSLALTGRVPCKVYGPVSKGDMMVSAGNGFAKSEVDPKIGTVIGKAIQNFNELEGVIEVVVGRL